MPYTPIRSYRRGGGTVEATVVTVTPGDTDYLAPAGTNTDDIDRTIIEFGPVDMGDETSSVPSDEIVFELTTPAGTDSVSDAVEYSANLTHAAGDDTGTLQDGFTLVFGEQPVGEEDASAVGSSVTTVQDYVDTATEVINGSPDVEWEDETNAEGVDDAAVASITLESGVGLPQTADSDLQMSFSSLGSTTIIDSSGNNYDLAVTGNPTVSASDFSGFVNKISFADNQYASASAAPFDLTQYSSFLIEARIGAITASAGNDALDQHIAGCFGSGAANQQWILFFNSADVVNNILSFVWADSGGTIRRLESAGGLMTDGNPHSLAVELDGTTLRMYIDGSVVASTTSNLTFQALGSQAMYVGGREGFTDRGADSGLDEIRFSDTARYAGAYTPATSPFASDSNTIGLYHMDAINNEGPVQGTRSGVVLRIRHRLDTTMALTSNVNTSLVLSKPDGSDPLTLLESVRAALSPVGDVNVRNDGALAGEDFDVTSHVSGWTEAELANALLNAHMDGSAIVAGGDAVWEIDSASLRRGYTVTGIT